MVKKTGQIYNHSQFQLSNPIIKAPVISSVASQTSSSIELIIASVPSIIDKKPNSVLCSKNSIQNDATITNNDDIQSCETQ